MANFFTEKAGPLPVWGWLAGGTVIILFFVSKKQGTSSSATTAQQLAAQQQAAALTAAASGVPGYGGSQGYGNTSGNNRRGRYSHSPTASSTPQSTSASTTTNMSNSPAGNTGPSTAPSPSATGQPDWNAISAQYLSAYTGLGGQIPSGQIQMPNVIGQDISTAQSSLQSQGFRVVTSGTGTVTSQDPGPGYIVVPGVQGTAPYGGGQSTVFLFGSSPGALGGASSNISGQTIVMPNVVGMTVEQAIFKLSEAGFGVQEVAYGTNSLKEASQPQAGTGGMELTVKQQQPAAGTAVPKDQYNDAIATIYF